MSVHSAGYSLKRHFHGNLTAGKFGISGQRETSACPGLKNEPAFQQARLMEPFSLQCSVSIRCTLRQKFLRLFFVLQFGWYSYSTTGCSTSLRSGTAAYRVRPSSFKTCGAARDSGSLLFSFLQRYRPQWHSRRYQSWPPRRLPAAGQRQHACR